MYTKKIPDPNAYLLKAGTLPLACEAVRIAWCPHNQGIVLARKTKEGSPKPWVTWEFRVDQPGYFWGHYFDDEEEARMDFRERCGRRLADVVWITRLNEEGDRS